ncbi:23S rRNA (uracil(1939)-C(5))-methyltransferase RlmD [Clostridium sp. E02]|uniref:23S rRNA (uracil(1939)-C(5))-methyltransferase RlmD n=1 Tax=Clostridium sp. E02 TaxID=2487134 RepID=UPI001FA9E8A6|nr:23S rRNA (uracil(1939)-C(5))-methyltransferase RlmD [Clostridium sp. E02]
MIDHKVKKETNRSEKTGKKRMESNKSNWKGEKKEFQGEKKYGKKSGSDQGDSRNQGDRRRDGDNRKPGDGRKYGDSRSQGDRRRDGDNQKPGDGRKYGDSRSQGDRRRDGENRKPGDGRKYGDSRSQGDRRRDGDNQKPGDGRKYGDSRSQGDRRRDGDNQKPGDGRKYGDSRGQRDHRTDGDNRKQGDGRGSDIRKKVVTSKCPVFYQCGGCQLLDMPYKKQLEQKKVQLEMLLEPFCSLEAMIGMEEPYHYRNKVHAVFDHEKGNPISGVYEANSHQVVPVEKCLIEDEKADEIIGTIRGMLKSFKIRTYDEDTGYGLLRHVLIRKGRSTGEIMVVLVTASPVFPSKNNFVKALREKHPEITTIIQNVNGRGTSMVLGYKEHVLFGKGYIEDVLCGLKFRISSKSFYQVNPEQTEILYKKAIEAAGLTGKERVIDAYCGVGTIGIVASKHAKEVIGVELNRDAVRDAIGNAKLNEVKNVKCYCNDAGKFMVHMAESGERVDVVFMDPPRSGSTEEFMDSVAKLQPKKVIYVSCGPETLARDLEYFKKKGYEAKKAWGVDMFPMTKHVEAVIMMTYCGKDKK